MHKFCMLVSASTLREINCFDRIAKGRPVGSHIYLWEHFESNRKISNLLNCKDKTSYVFGDTRGSGKFHSSKIYLEEFDFPYRQTCYIQVKANEKKVAISADPTGTRSLFWCRGDGYIIVSSSISYIRRCLHWNYFQLDYLTREFSLSFGYYPPERTPFEKIHEILPGDALSLDLNKSDSLQKWHPKNGWKKSKPVNINRPIDEQLYSVFEACLMEQLGDHKRVGVLLGGVDSALVVAILHRLGVVVETFTFRYKNTVLNQPYINEIGDLLSIRNHWIDIDEQVMLDMLKRYSEISSYPTLWAGYVLQTAYTCKKIWSLGIRLCFSGDGCDTAFMGYPSTHKRGGIYKRLPVVPSRFSQSVVSLINICRGELWLGHVCRVIKSLITAAPFPIEKRPIRSFQIFDDWAKNNIIGPENRHCSEIDEILYSQNRKLDGLSFERQMYKAKSFFSPNRNKLITASDVSGLTIYSPYMHPALMSFVSALPDSLLRPKGGQDEGKELLMKMAEKKQLLPIHIIRQKKLAAITAPVDAWFQQSLRVKSFEYLMEAELIFNESYIETLFDDLLVEKVYKKHFSDDKVVSVASSLLTTYAALCR